MAFNKNGIPEFGDLNQLKSMLRARKDQLPVLVAVDFEGLGNIISGFIHDKNSQAGVATLDTRALFSKDFDNINITVSNYICGSQQYWEERSGRAKWGYTERINKSEMLDSILGAIPRNRNIIIVGHGLKSDLDCLKTVGFDFSNVTAIFDTHETARDLHLGAFKLCDLARTLGHQYPPEFFHTASNDAVIALQAILNLYLRTKKAFGEVNNKLEPRLKAFIKIKMHPTTHVPIILQDTTTEESRAKPAKVIFIKARQTPPPRVPTPVYSPVAPNQGYTHKEPATFQPLNYQSYANNTDSVNDLIRMYKSCLRQDGLWQPRYAF